MSWEEDEEVAERCAQDRITASPQRGAKPFAPSKAKDSTCNGKTRFMLVVLADTDQARMSRLSTIDYWPLMYDFIHVHIHRNVDA